MIRIGVIRGGSNVSGYQKSISDGSIILRALREHNDYEPCDVLIDKNETIYVDGVETLPAKLAYKVDLCISTIIKPLAKNISVERMLKTFNIPCIIPPTESLRGYIPDSLKQQINNAGIRTPKRLPIDFSDENLPQLIHKTFSPPYSLIKINADGRVEDLANVVNIEKLYEILEDPKLDHSQKYMIEEYIHGDEWAVTVMPNFRGSLWYSLHPIYLKTINPAFSSTAPISRSALENSPALHVRESLDLYTKLASGVIKPQIPTTFIFRHVEKRKPVLLRIIHRHMLGDHPEVLQALEASTVSPGEFVDCIIKGMK